MGSWVTATHIPEALNKEADTASRHFNPRLKWNLDSSVFQRIVDRFYLPDVDLQKYVSRFPDPGAIAVDSFLQDWSSGRFLIHPPVNLLLRVVRKIQEDRASALVIAPNWPNQPWFPQLVQMLVGYPLRLPTSRSLLYLPFDPQAYHPLWATLRLTVSGDASKQKDFRQRLSNFSCPHGPPERYTRVPGEHGRIGVQTVDGDAFQHL